MIGKKSFIAALLLSTAVTAMAADGTALRRFGLFVGSNDGGRERVTLAYAASDASMVQLVLEEVGGVGRGDSVLLTDPDSNELRAGFDKIKREIETARRTNRRVEFVLYYSGHSDEEGILLGGERFAYPELREYITNMGADVNIAILDSCASGAFTRTKGGSRQAPFLVDESIATKGHAFITSSSADEAAQESDSIGASFFTHYFVSGLRGAADSTRDGKVTLDEVYTYAFSETLGRTSTTLAGPQHAVRELSLAGSGDLVLTDLRIASAGITFDESVSGRMFVTDDNGRLVAEIRKESGSPMTFALPPGRYRLTLETGSDLREREVVLSRSSRIEIASDGFRDRTPEVARERGNTQSSTLASSDTEGFDEQAFESELETLIEHQVENSLIHLDYLFSLIPDRPFEPERRVIHDLSLKLVGSSYRIEGFDIGLLNLVEEDVKGAQIGAIGGIVGDDVYGAQVSGVFNLNSGRVFGGQVAGVVNISHGPIYGAQVAGVFNISESSVQSVQTAGVFNIASGQLNGFQSGGVFNIVEGRVRGAQAGGVFNIADGDVQGGQAAGVFNIADGYVRGVQAAGVLNIAGSDLYGGQFAGLFNIADNEVHGIQAAGLFGIAGGSLNGLQASGLFNVAGDVNGAQLSLINIGGNVHGMQVGLVNISDRMYGVPIGLINISGNGLFDPSVWTDDTGFTYAGMQIGAGPIYTLLYSGTPNNQAWTAASLGLGMGLHFEMGPVYLDADLSAKSFGTGANFDEALRAAALVFADAAQQSSADGSRPDFSGYPIYPSIRLQTGLRLFGRVAIFGGAAFETVVSSTQERNDYFHRGNPWQLTTENSTIDLYPRWFVGLRI